MSYYREVLIETYEHHGGASKHKIRARAVDGQGINTEMNVECSLDMRESHPVGTYFLLDLKEKSKEGGPAFLYAHYEANYKIVTKQEADEYIGKLVKVYN